jgi:hypothetical protein
MSKADPQDAEYLSIALEFLAVKMLSKLDEILQIEGDRRGLKNLPDPSKTYEEGIDRLLDKYPADTVCEALERYSIPLPRRQ